MKYRFKCECGKLYDSNDESMACPSCQKENSTEGFGIIQLNRPSNYIGCLIKMNIFIDDQPYGPLADSSSIKLVVPYGTHKLRTNMSTVKRCKDQELILSAEEPVAYFKTGVDFFGTQINISPSTKEKMPAK